MMLKTGDLEVFKAVAESGSLSGAAARLHCVQSNVTARIKGLEAQLGTALFYRKPRGISLTPGGRALMSYAETILRLLEEAEQAVSDLDGRGGSLRLGSMETTAAVRLPTPLARYHEAFPEVEIMLSTGTTEALVERTLAFEIDGAFVAGAIEHPDLVCEPIFVEELVLVTEPGCRRPEALKRRALLVFREGCTYRTWAEQWARASGLLPIRLMEFGTLDGILGCVGAGMGMTLLPRAVVERSGYRGRFAIHPLPAGSAVLPTCFIRRKDALMTGAMSGFLEMVGQVAIADSG